MLFIHSVLFLMLVATIVAQTGVPRIRYRVDPWTISVETPQNEIHPYESDKKSLGADEQGELTESPVWFLFLVVPMVCCC
ncbi:hypothetical protein J4Q44_G00135200 [Coregonus suidteri]|uniref:Uncharacterized protein n=1 Tax=Coregonus suidteri TaxID=861788 RepID=A0AAN8QXS1_9TELE